MADVLLSEPQRRGLHVLTAALTQRLAAMGQQESGLYNYYVRKLSHDALLSQCDLLAIEALRMRRGQFARIWEIGPGIGQLSIMLALDGHHLVLLEHDNRRMAALVAMLDQIVAAIDAEARARVDVRPGSIPEAIGAADAIEQDAVLALNCAFTASDAKRLAFERTVARFGFGLIDFPRLFTETADREEWGRRAHAFAETNGVRAKSIAAYVVPEERKAGELFLTHR
jgi:hypothetical protein